MKLKERLRKVNVFLNTEKEVSEKLLELEELEENLSQKKIELEMIEKNINEKKSELETLRIEAIELKDFINNTFLTEINNYDYKVDITHCYIIDINGKKYITLRQKGTTKSNSYSVATGKYNVETYTYYDALTLDEEGKCQYLYQYKHGYYDTHYFQDNFINKKHSYERHILEVYPELITFIDNWVPNTYLKKIYYEINDLGSKKLIKS